MWMSSSWKQRCAPVTEPVGSLPIGDMLLRKATVAVSGTFLMFPSVRLCRFELAIADHGCPFYALTRSLPGSLSIERRGRFGMLVRAQPLPSSWCEEHRG